MAGKVEHSAARLKRTLGGLGDGQVKASQSRFFKEPVDSLGIRTPDLRGLARVAAREYRDLKLPVADVIDIAERLWGGRYLEERILGVLILERFQRHLEPDHWPRFDAWVDSLSNWGETDALCGCVLAPLVRAEPELIERLIPWTESPNRWRRRAAAVTLVPLARHGDRIDAALQVADRLAEDEDDMVAKGIGWLLKEASRTQPQTVVDFLMDNIYRLSRTTVRYACEKLTRRQRQRVMSA